MFKEIIITKMIKEKGAVDIKLSISNIAVDAIEMKWDSLAFADNKDIFIMAEAEGYVFELVTNGEVRILKDNGTGEVMYNNTNVQEIKELVVSKEIYTDEYIIDANNWFALGFGRKLDDGRYNIEDDVIFEDTPDTIDSLIEIIVKHVCSCLKR